MPRVGQTIALSSPTVVSSNPFWMTPDKVTVRLHLGHVLARLRLLPANSVHCVITSPPYWGLRDYKTEPILWEDGWLGSYGNEPTPDMFVAHTVSIFREVRRVLRDDGTLWLNLGDSYSGGKMGRADHGVNDPTVKLVGNSSGAVNVGYAKQRPATEGIPSGNLVGIPWRVALALQADGWILRQDIIWHKPSPMPESVRNRCTKAHEYVFLFAKKQGYYFDAEAIKEPATPEVVKRVAREITKERELHTFKQNQAVSDSATISSNASPNAAWHSPEKAARLLGGSNKRGVWTVDDETALFSWMAENAPETLAEYLGDKEYKGDVWRIASQGYAGAHFATYPPRLIEPMIKAGTSEKGCCVKCGAPWKRLTKKEKLKRERPNDYVKRTGEEGTGNSCANSVAGVSVETLGWEATCKCGIDRTQPCIVLDPFTGSGTTAATCIGLGRRSWGIELSETYLRENAIPRIQKAIESRLRR